MNRLEGTIDATEGKAGILSVRVATDAGPLEALVFGTPEPSGWLSPGGLVRALFKESDVLLAAPGSLPWPGAIEATVESVSDSDILSRVDLRCGCSRVTALVPSRRLAAQGIRPGSPVDLWIPPHEIVLEEPVP